MQRGEATCWRSHSRLAELEGRPPAALGSPYPVPELRAEELSLPRGEGGCHIAQGPWGRMDKHMHICSKGL